MNIMNMKKPLFIIGFLGCITIALLLGRITLENSISTTGITLVDMQNEINTYKNENELLKVQYLSEASFTHIAAKAKKLGYIPVANEVDLTAPLPLALR
jgi:hypothetical protein